MRAWLVGLACLVAGCTGRAQQLGALVAAVRPSPCTHCQPKPGACGQCEASSATEPAPPASDDKAPLVKAPSYPEDGYDVIAAIEIRPYVENTWVAVEAELPDLVVTLCRPGLGALSAPYEAYRRALSGEALTTPTEAWQLLLETRAAVLAEQRALAKGVLVDAAVAKVEWVRKAPVLAPAGKSPAQQKRIDAAITRGFRAAFGSAVPEGLPVKVLALASARVVSATPRLHGKKAVVTADTAGSPPAP